MSYWYESEKGKEWSRKYYEKNKEYILQVHKTWSEKNVDQGGTIWRKYKRRARLKNPNLDKEYRQRKKLRMSNIDFEKDQTEVLDKTENIDTLAKQIKHLRTLEDEVKSDEEDLKNKQKEVERISGEVIPTMLSEMGLSSLKLADGSAVDVKPYYGANISEVNREKAYDWLRSNGLGDIIKNNITVSFGMNEDNKAAEYANLARGQGFQPTQKLKVEPMTLKALVRERIEAGKDMPMDIFNVFVGNRTKITRKQ